ncbi:MAG: hypothetical protein KJ990_08590 [Proteobacteria bacterium]|nr:hypothetical protein [Pseudomonadota bacterium]MBU1649149.1 hypothetical protein [Pseudomonadota bacterium]
MVGQMTGMTPLTGAERIQRPSVGEGTSAQENNVSSNKQGAVDSTSFSPAALAIAKNVPPAGESAEQGKAGPNESENVAENSLEKRINIRV